MTDKPTLLIVDDAATNIQALAHHLKEDYQLKVATSGERALELSLSNPMPQLILLDIKMPMMDGYLVCRQLKSNELTADIPVIFVTSLDDEEDEQQGLELGAVDYITKPIRPCIVKARIKTHIRLKQQSDKLKKIALHDQLTGLYNRHYLMEVAEQKVSLATRYGHPISLLMIDLDHFKSINDHYGHQAGDEVLIQLAAILTQHNRKEDVIARFGGEEFVILLDHCNLKDAQDRAENLRCQIEGIKLNSAKVTASLGCSELNQQHSDFFSMLSHADNALYQAKEQGRNQVVSCCIGAPINIAP